MTFDQRHNQGDHARASPGFEVGASTRRGTQALLGQARCGPSALRRPPLRAPPFRGKVPADFRRLGPALQPTPWIAFAFPSPLARPRLILFRLGHYLSDCFY